jgi:hypothetical protein
MQNLDFPEMHAHSFASIALPIQVDQLTIPFDFHISMKYKKDQGIGPTYVPTDKLSK